MNQPQPPTPGNPQLAKMIDLLQIQVDDSPQMHTEIMDALTTIIGVMSEILGAIKTAPIPQAQSSELKAQPAPANVRDFIAETLVMTTDDKGAPAYKAKGFPYAEFGVRVWPEVLPALGIDSARLKPGPNPLPAGLIVRALLNDEGKPRKIISKGDGSAMTATPTNGNGHNHASQPPAPEEDIPF